MGKYSLPKTTVWHNIQGVKLTKEGAATIRSSRGGNSVRCEKRWTAAQAKADSILNDFREESSWPVLLAALYWAEGTKKTGFVFTNTDPAMIRIFLKLVRKYLHIPDEDMDILIRICDPMKPGLCRKYWSTITEIPVRNVRTNYHDAYNKSTTTYGMCRISFRKGGDHLKLMHCLTRGITAKMLAPL